MTERQQNRDPEELAKFASQAGRWWDPEGPFRTLHEINPLRTEYIGRRATLRDARVLDVGCGGGLLTEALARKGARVTGLDLVQKSLDAAREHAASAGLSIDYVCEDVAEYAESHAGTFDIVTCLELLEHVPDPEAVIRACAEAARPGAALFFSTINRNAKSFVLAIACAEYALGLLPKGSHEYMKLIRPAELAGWCRRAGLVLRDLTGMHFNPLTRDYHLGGNVDVNYLCHAIKPEPAT
jgi:2-polyprenyl-6-hydroxyphenyl methylase/3-demethylubiquinone-9 3-methyltransferase